MRTVTSSHMFWKNNEGFSLIEIMIALGIFSIGILAVASMQISAAQGNLSARLRTEAVTLASEQLEVVASEPYTTIGSVTETIGIYTLERDVTDNSPVVGAKNIVINVEWTDRGTSQSTSLRYIKADL